MLNSKESSANSTGKNVKGSIILREVKLSSLQTIYLTKAPSKSVSIGFSTYLSLVKSSIALNISIQNSGKSHCSLCFLIPIEFKSDLSENLSFP